MDFFFGSFFIFSFSLITNVSPLDRQVNYGIQCKIKQDTQEKAKSEQGLSIVCELPRKDHKNGIITRAELRDRNFDQVMRKFHSFHSWTLSDGQVKCQCWKSAPLDLNNEWQGTIDCACPIQFGTAGLEDLTFTAWSESSLDSSGLAPEVIFNPWAEQGPEQSE
jgi:hypothetical protein